MDFFDLRWRRSRLCAQTSPLPPLRLEALEERDCPSVNFVFDYSKDTSGFFASNPQAEADLQQAGQMIGSQLNNNLSAITPSGGNAWEAAYIDPSTGATIDLSNLSIAGNTVYIFVGAKNTNGGALGNGGPGTASAVGSPSFQSAVNSRGQSGFAPWGGSITFDSTANWYFGTDPSGIGANQYDFLSVCVHELGHVLGIATSSTWNGLVSSSYFHGADSESIYGGPVPSSSDGWAANVTSHGTPTAMSPYLSSGQRKMFTPLDWAGLADIGWQVNSSDLSTGTSSSTTYYATPSAHSGSTPAPSVTTPDGIGVFNPQTATWYLNSSASAGSANAGSFQYGGVGWIPVVGDWDGNGTVTIGVYDPSTATWYLRNSNSAGMPDIGPFQYGSPGWIPVVGDWNHTGLDGIGVYDPSTGMWYLRNEANAGPADAGIFQYGGAGWDPVVGDWNGSGSTGIGVFNPANATWYLRYTASPGQPDIAPFQYGGSGWTPVAGDWNGDGRDTIGVYDPTSGTWYLRNSNGPGSPDISPFGYGMAGWKPVAGTWNGQPSSLYYPPDTPASGSTGNSPGASIPTTISLTPPTPPSNAPANSGTSTGWTGALGVSGLRFWNASGILNVLAYLDGLDAVYAGLI